uniref:Uncharacterized protein n=1 Tax=Solanum tuberosum TaxID=4113 RepID=M1DSI6_SOLTU
MANKISGVTSTSQSLPPRCYKDLPIQAIRQARPLSAGRLLADLTPSPKGTSLQPSTMRIRDSISEKSDVVAGTPPLTQHYVHPGVSPTPTPAETSALASGQRDRIDRVMIEPDGSSWYPANDAARTLKDSVRRLFTQTYHSWSEIPNSIRQAMFNERKKKWGALPLYRIFKKTHVKKKENESDPNVWVKERAE